MLCRRNRSSALAAAAALSQPTVDLVSAVSGAAPSVLEPAVGAHLIELDDDRIRLRASVARVGRLRGAADAAGRRQLHSSTCPSSSRIPRKRARDLARVGDRPNSMVAAAIDETPLL